MNARELITDAYYLSGIVAEELETVSGNQISRGLTVLNDILLEKSNTGTLIPYIAHTSFNSVKGQEEYFLPNFVELQELTFNIDTIRYPMRRDSRRRYFGAGRVDNIENLPFHYYSERELGGIRIYLYFIPNESTYELRATGKISLTEEDLDDDISSNLDRYYLLYLKYAVANDLCEYNDIVFAPQKAQRLHNLEVGITDVNKVDFSRVKKTTLTRRSSLTWADVNLGKGYTTTSGGY